MCVCVCVCVCVCACCAPRVRAISLVPSTAVNCNQNDPTLDNRPSKKFTQSKHPNQCTSSEHPNTYIVEHTSLKKKHIDDKLSLSCTHISEDTSGLDTRDIKQVHLSSNHIHTSLNTHHLDTNTSECHMYLPHEAVTLVFLYPYLRAESSRSGCARRAIENISLRRNCGDEHSNIVMLAHIHTHTHTLALAQLHATSAIAAATAQRQGPDGPKGPPYSMRRLPQQQQQQQPT